MTLQDFFISGLPTGGNPNQSRSRTSSMSLDKPAIEHGASELNRLKVEQKLLRPTIAAQKIPPPAPKGIDRFVENEFPRKHF